MENEKTAQMIVNSKSFRKHLKSIIEFDKQTSLYEREEFAFVIENGEMVSAHHQMAVEHKGSINFSISRESLNRTIKALKAATEQPIRITVFESSMRWTVELNF